MVWLDMLTPLSDDGKQSQVKDTMIQALIVWHRGSE